MRAFNIGMISGRTPAMTGPVIASRGCGTRSPKRACPRPTSFCWKRNMDRGGAEAFRELMAKAPGTTAVLCVAVLTVGACAQQRRWACPCPMISRSPALMISSWPHWPNQRSPPYTCRTGKWGGAPRRCCCRWSAATARRHASNSALTSACGKHLAHRQRAGARAH